MTVELCARARARDTSRETLLSIDLPNSPRRSQALCAISCLLSWCREVRSGVVVVVSPITCTHVATPLQC